MASAPSLYVHVPFCSSRCSYCDFHTRASSGPELGRSAEAWLEAVGRHLDAVMQRFDLSGFRTVYFGGGTPSWLPRNILAGALSRIRSCVGTGGGHPAEWTVEANPEDIDTDLLRLLEDAGVNRLSVGVQSLEEKARRAACRRGDAEAVNALVETLSRGWTSAWSADLMFGLPGQTTEGIARDASYIADAGASHVSLYELTLETGTPLHSAAVAGAVRLPDEDERADMYDAAAEMLSGAGFGRYEVSNWAKPGYECIHNEVYWDMGDWLALGPSGVGNLYAGNGSFLRMENTASDDLYCSDPTGSATEYSIVDKDAMVECLMTAMRTAKGFDMERFESRFRVDPVAVFGELHASHPESVRFASGRWTPTSRGMDTLNATLVSALSHADLYFKTR